MTGAAQAAPIVPEKGIIRKRQIMKDRDFVKEIEKLRTAVLGYDREEVVLYIRELVEYYGQKNDEAVRELYLEKMQLVAENAGLRAQIPTQEKLCAEAEGKAEKILGGA